MRDNLAPLVESGKLACVLAQFPHGFKPERETITYLKRVIGAFEELSVVVEFRNAAWQTPETFELLRAAGAGFSNVDMPRLEGLLTPSSDVTSPVGYVRFHGRNGAQWWRGTNVTRYAYEYTVEELVPWTDRIAEIEAPGDRYVRIFQQPCCRACSHDAEAIEMLLDDRYGDTAATVVAASASRNAAKGERQLGLFTDLDGEGRRDHRRSRDAAYASSPEPISERWRRCAARPCGSRSRRPTRRGRRPHCGDRRICGTVERARPASNVSSMKA